MCLKIHFFMQYEPATLHPGTKLLLSLLSAGELCCFVFFLSLLQCNYDVLQ